MIAAKAFWNVVVKRAVLILVSKQIFNFELVKSKCCGDKDQATDCTMYSVLHGVYILTGPGAEWNTLGLRIKIMDRTQGDMSSS
jgi:hypothetical protein